MARIACPYCYTVQTFVSGNECEGCHRDVPRAFIKAAQRIAPVYLATMGVTQHGKTVYLDSIAVTIENLGKITEHTFHDYLDDSTFKSIRDIRVQVLQRQDRKATTPTENPEPLLINLHNFLDTSVIPLVIYDLAGEIFDDRSAIEYYTRAMQHVHTVWFVVSLADLREDKEGRTLSDLFNVYRAGMERIDVDANGRNLLVVYSKADRISSSVPAEIRSYLQRDPYVDLATLSRRQAMEHSLDYYSYLLEMRKISDLLFDYTYDEVPGGVPFINMVKQSGMNLRFTVTSAIGRDSSGGAGSNLQYRRWRVLDPLIWAIDLNKPIGKDANIALIIDASSDALFQNDFLDEFFKSLSKYGQVTIYFMGTTSAASSPSEMPPSEPPKHITPALIGPILDQLGTADRALLITARSVRDLPDFDNVDLRARLGIVAMRDGLVTWARSITYMQQLTPVDTIVSKLMDSGNNR